MKTWRNIRRVAMLAAVLALLFFTAASWFASGRLVASANRAVGPPPNGYTIESITIRSDSGSNIAAWHVPCEGASATVILLHPVRSDRRAMLGRAQLLHDAGYASLLIDLQAHGESPGKNVTAGYRERLDVVTAVNYVRSTHPKHRIGIIGWSMGGAAALLASPLKIDALVIESVYPSIEEAVHNRVSMRLGPLSHLLTPLLIAHLQLKLGITTSDIRPIDHISAVRCPVLVAGGDCDTHTPLEETMRLFDAASEPKQLVVFPGAAHTDLQKYDPDKYNEIVAFLGAHLAGGD